MHNPLLHRLLVEARQDDLRRAGEAQARAKPRPVEQRQASIENSITLRFGFPDDASALAQLAALDSSEPPAGPVLLAEVGGALRAALSLADGTLVAHPFHATSALVELLRARARQLEHQDSISGSRGRRRWSRLGLPVWR